MKAPAYSQQETEVSSLQQRGWATLEMGPLTPVKLSSDCDLSLCLALNSVGDPEPESLG